MVVQENNIDPTTVMGFDNSTEIDYFLFNHMNTTQGVYLFNVGVDPLTNLTLYDYQIQVNQTDQSAHGELIPHLMTVFNPMQYWLERAILKVTTNSTLTVNMLNFAHPQVLALNEIGQNGPLCFLAALMFNFVAGLGLIVFEKEQKLREIMKLMGLYDSSYWFSWFITLLIFSTWTVLSVIAFGCIFQFNFFLKNAFGLYFFLLFLFALTLIPLGFLISALVKKANQATNVGFLVFIFSFFMLLGAAFIFDKSIGAPKALIIVFSLLSPAMFQLGLSELGTATAKSTYPGLSWSIVSDVNALQNGNYSFADMYAWLILDFFLYLLIALYLDNVLPNEYGVRRPLYYFLMPSYWRGTSRPTDKKVKKSALKEEELDKLDEDVKAERDAIQKDELPDDTRVIIKDLTKIFSGIKKHWYERSRPFVAVNNLNLSIQANTLLALLGIVFF